jgi:hypothetical protein
MLPDVHFRAGLACTACHTMQSMLAGAKSARKCRDCHRPSLKIAAHRIGAHLDRLACTACHAAWSPQEYGTFFLRFTEPARKEDFDLRPLPSSEYLRSSYLRRQDLPPLGLDSSGLVSPIRPEFIAYYTDIGQARRGGRENLLLAAEWRAFSPHTIQRGTAGCAACHDNPRRFLAEPEAERIFLLRKDGLTLDSFWNRSGQRVVNGGFYPLEKLQSPANAGKTYIKEEIGQWQRFLGAPSSAR